MCRGPPVNFVFSGGCEWVKIGESFPLWSPTDKPKYVDVLRDPRDILLLLSPFSMGNWGPETGSEKHLKISNSNPMLENGHVQLPLSPLQESLQFRWRERACTFSLKWGTGPLVARSEQGFGMTPGAGTQGPGYQMVGNSRSGVEKGMMRTCCYLLKGGGHRWGSLERVTQ